jgi:KamA family protein
LTAGREAKRLFALRVPRAFAARMKKGDPNDPLLRQVLTAREEFVAAPGYSTDPLEEQESVVPGLLHKYRNRALLLVKGGCAVNCRYCFRRHFPYAENQGNKRNWQVALDYIAQQPELDEIIFSGGDPLMAKDHELDWLIAQLEAIPHIKRCVFTAGCRLSSRADHRHARRPPCRFFSADSAGEPYQSCPGNR